MPTLASEPLVGSCACGQLRYVIKTPTEQIAPPIACHCRECRKQSGHYWCAFSVPYSDVVVESTEVSEPIAWVQLSPQARRGSCPHCHSFVFWQARATDQLDDKVADSDDYGSPELEISAGSLDNPPADWLLTEHIFTAEQGRYYTIDGACHRQGAT